MLKSAALVLGLGLALASSVHADSAVSGAAKLPAGMACQSMGAAGAYDFATLSLSQDGKALVPADAAGKPKGLKLLIEQVANDGQFWTVTGKQEWPAGLGCLDSCPSTRFELKVHAHPDFFDGHMSPMPDRNGLVTITTDSFSEELGLVIEFKTPVRLLCHGLD